MRLCYGVLFAFVVACGGSTSDSNPPPPGPPAPPPAPGTVFVAIHDYDYAPDSIVVPAGTPVRWANGGAMVHSVTSDSNAFESPYLSPAGTDQSGQPTGGGTYTRTFTTPGTFPYHCEVHKTLMKGKVVVNP